MLEITPGSNSSTGCFVNALGLAKASSIFFVHHVASRMAARAGIINDLKKVCFINTFFNY